MVWNNVQPTDIVNGNEMTVFPQSYSTTYTGVIIDNCNLQETAFQIPLEIFQYSGPSFVVEDGEVTKENCLNSMSTIYLQMCLNLFKIFL